MNKLDKLLNIDPNGFQVGQQFKRTDHYLSFKYYNEEVQLHSINEGMPIRMDEYFTVSELSQYIKIKEFFFEGDKPFVVLENQVLRVDNKINEVKIESDFLSRIIKKDYVEHKL